MTEPVPEPVGPPAEDPVPVAGTRLLQASLAAIAIGFLALIVGAVVLTGSQALQVATASGRAKVGNPITFEAEDTEYAILFIAEPTTRDFVDDRIGQMDCDVHHPDGSTEALDPGSASVRTSTSVGIFAAKFQGQAGPTELDCRWTGPSDLGGFYTVGKSGKTTQLIGAGALVGGVVLILGGIVGMVRARRASTAEQA